MARPVSARPRPLGERPQYRTHQRKREQRCQAGQEPLCGGAEAVDPIGPPARDPQYPNTGCLFASSPHGSCQEGRYNVPINPRQITQFRHGNAFVHLMLRRAHQSEFRTGQYRAMNRASRGPRRRCPTSDRSPVAASMAARRMSTSGPGLDHERLATDHRRQIEPVRIHAPAWPAPTRSQRGPAMPVIEPDIQRRTRRSRNNIRRPVPDIDAWSPAANDGSNQSVPASIGADRQRILMPGASRCTGLSAPMRIGPHAPASHAPPASYSRCRAGRS